MPNTIKQFLLQTEISIPLRAERSHRIHNTRSRAYPAEHVRVQLRPGFPYESIMASQYAHILNTQMPQVSHLSPAAPVFDEKSVETRIHPHVIRRVARALGASHFPPGHTRLSIDAGSAAPLQGAVPDLAGYTTNPSTNRVPGDVKCSWKWRSNWIHSTVREENLEFYVVAAQLNFYMNKTGSRFGYILTDAELVIFRKLPEDYSYNMQMAPGIPLRIFNHPGVPQSQIKLTALLCLWYIHMLAGDDTFWRVRIHPGTPPTDDCPILYIQQAQEDADDVDDSDEGGESEYMP